MQQLSSLELRVLEIDTVACQDVTALLGAFVEGELIACIHEKIENHIRGCPHCLEGELRYREVISLAKELTPPPLPEGVSRRLREALNSRLGLSLTIPASSHSKN
jgi:hypothetical protein